MYSNCCKEELIVKLVGKLSLEFPEHKDQLKIRELIETVIYPYDVTPQCQALVTSDIEEKLSIYLASKKLDGLSNKTLKGYLYDLNKFADYMHKTVNSITTIDLRRYLAERCKDMKSTSVNTTISHLKSFFGWLCDEEYIPKNPAKKLNNGMALPTLQHIMGHESPATTQIYAELMEENIKYEYRRVS